MDQLHQSILILSLGVLVIIAVLLKSRLKEVGLPSSVGFIAVGFLLNYINTQAEFITPAVKSVFEVLMKLGVIALLFEIGLESDLHGLAKQLKKASLISIVNLLICGFAGFAAVYWVCGMGLIPGLFAGTALTATSVGISLSVWKETGSLKSRNGELLL
ncbi:MAG: cation:proton antiporter, partial [Spirochaetota bacterium]